MSKSAKPIDRWMLEDIAMVKVQDEKYAGYGAHAFVVKGIKFNVYCKKTPGGYTYGRQINGDPVSIKEFDQRLASAQGLAWDPREV